MQTKIGLGLLLTIVAAVGISTPLPASADDLASAKALLAKSERALKAAHSATADVALVETAGGSTIRKIGTAALLKPNYLRFELWAVPAGKTKAAEVSSARHEIVVSDGRNVWKSVIGDNTRVQSRPASAGGSELAGLSDLLWSDFFSGGTNTTEQLMSMIKSATLTTERWHGADFKVINAKLKLDDAPNSKGNYTVKLYIDKNHLLDRAIMNAGKFTYEISMSNVRLDPPLRPSQFAFHKPAYAKIEQSHIDPKAVALLSKADSTAGRMNAITATVHTDAGIASDSKGGLTRSSTETTCKLMRPNNVVIQTLATKNGDKPPYDEPLTTTISDGTTLWTINNEDKTYTRTDLSERPWQLTGVMFSGPLADFFMPRWSTAVDESRTAPMSVTYAGTQQWKNASYRVVEIDQTLSEGQESMRTRQTLYVGADNLVHRLIRRDYFSGKLATETDSYIVALDTAPKLAKADFAFTPSAEMKEAKADDAGEAPSKPLLANGTVAPDFTVHDRAGNPIRLSDYKGHVVVLDFWATWCGPCQESLPSTNAVARKYLKKDVVVLGVNVWDKPDAFNAWLPEHKNYDAIKFAIDPTGDQKDVASSLYNVSGIPTQYVIDGLGRIVWSTDGFSGSDDDLVAAVEKALKQE